MPFAQRVAVWLIVPLVVLTGPVHGEDTPTADESANRSWHGPAAAAAAAAAETAAPIVPPLPVPAAAPAQSQANPAVQAQAVPAQAQVAPATEAAAKPVKAVEMPAATPIKPVTAPVAAATPAATSTAAPAAKNAAPAKDAKDKKKQAKEKPKKPVLTAKQLFGTVKSPAPLAARSIGWYAKGCLAGAQSLAVDGPAWQVMRLSRNRNWGHPKLVELVERLARESAAAKEWPGLLVGDISQPRGGPMISGHASHQVGLDADIWLTPMPDHTLTRREREDLSATSMLASNEVSVNPKVWGDGQVKLIKRAASYSAVERVLVHPAIKKALCEAAGTDRAWLSKVRPYFGHYYHFHVRISCPASSGNCQKQPPVPGDDGCGAELKDWLKKVTPKKPSVEAAKPPEKPSKPSPKKPEITLADLPADCKAVLTAGGNVPPTVPAEVVDNSKNAAPTKSVAESSGDDTAPPAATTAASAH